jgi:hypothetical protein
LFETRATPGPTTAAGVWVVGGGAEFHLNLETKAEKGEPPQRDQEAGAEGKWQGTGRTALSIIKGFGAGEKTVSCVWGWLNL